MTSPKENRGILAVNLLWLSTQDQTGAFVFVKNLLDRMFELDSKTPFLLLVRWRDRQFFKQRYSHRPNVAMYTSDPRCDLLRRPILALKKILAKWQKNESKMETLIAQELNRLIHRQKIQKMFSPVQIIYPRGLVGVQHYVTILDLQHEYLSDNFSPQELARRRESMANIIKTAHHIFAISEYTKKTLIEKCSIAEEKISVTPLAPDNLEVRPEPIDVPKPFLFYPAALWPHKNHRLLIEVLRQLAPSQPDLHLVFSGLIKKKKLKAELDALIDKASLEKKVHFLGFVSDQAVTWLYQNAALLVFPSSFEGFGMPLLEAYRHGLPVVAACNSSITEVAGDAALLCETNNVGEFTTAINQLLNDEKMRQELKSKMPRQLKKFSWTQTAQKTLEKLL
jgi:glycosyltransferase involved in cell wall biosynthesis